MMSLLISSDIFVKASCTLFLFFYFCRYDYINMDMHFFTNMKTILFFSSIFQTIVCELFLYRLAIARCTGCPIFVCFMGFLVYEQRYKDAVFTLRCYFFMKLKMLHTDMSQLSYFLKYRANLKLLHFSIPFVS